MTRRLPDRRDGRKARWKAAPALLDRAVRAWDAARVWIEDHPDLTFHGSICLLAFVGLVALSPLTQAPELALYAGSSFLMFALPVILVANHRLRQARIVGRVRALYALAEAAVMKDRRDDAQRKLASILRWERHWQIGNSEAYQLAYSAFVVMSTSLVALVHYVLYVYFGSEMGYEQPKFGSVAEAASWLLALPADAAWYVGFSLLIGISASQYLSDLRDQAWAEFYGDKLRRALNAGRCLQAASKPTGVKDYAAHAATATASARELLGLPARFTKAELRRAWVRLARELHPDRWHSEGAEVMKMKEAALKRVNQARDELLPQAVG
jgi:hypothetical protein